MSENTQNALSKQCLLSFGTCSDN